MDTMWGNSIFTNVAKTDDGDVWWEDMSEPPAHLVDWKGNDWTPDAGTPAAHPNARFTAPASQCPCIAPEWEDPAGVPISAILIGGRRPRTIPLVHQTFDWTHGIFDGSIMGSEITAAAISAKIGQVRRDPFAMLPFIGYNVCDYLQHWLDVGAKSTADKLPKIFYVNWFRKGENGKFLWPGFGDNSRVLKWVVERVNGKVDAEKTAIGYLPKKEDLYLEGLNVSDAAIDELFHLEKEEWLAEVESIKEHYASYGEKMPKALKEQLKALEARVNAM